MKRWQYQIMTYWPTDNGDEVGFLNSEGEQGWELVTLGPAEGCGTRYVFKRSYRGAE